MDWCYLSPHLDDAVLSCGGWIWEQIRAGDQVEVWTIFAGDPSPLPLTPFAHKLHQRWGVGPEAASSRREEDRLACQILGAGWRHFPYPDCIYRYLPDSLEPVVCGESDLFAEVSQGEAGLVDTIAQTLAGELPSGARLVLPLTLGGHVDHRLARLAAEQAAVRSRVKALAYFADYPYALQEAGRHAELIPSGWEPVVCPVSPAGLEAWQRAVAAYSSQISTFWTDLPQMRLALKQYWEIDTGFSLWFSLLF